LPLTPSTGLTLYHHALAAPRQAHHPAGGEVLGWCGASCGPRQPCAGQDRGARGRRGQRGLP